MAMDPASHQSLTCDVSRQILAEIAPNEIESFAAAANHFFTDAELAEEEAEDDPLAFGVDAAVVVAPVVITVVYESLKFVRDELVKSSRGAASEWIEARVKKIFKSGGAHDDAEADPLTREQLQTIERIALKRAAEFGMPKETARNLARALVGSLAVRKG